MPAVYTCIRQKFEWGANGGSAFVTSRRGRGPLFSKSWIMFYSSSVAIKRQRRFRDLCAVSLGRKAGWDGAVPLHPAFLHLAEFGLFCHTSKLAEQRKRPSASSCGLFLEAKAAVAYPASMRGGKPPSCRMRRSGVPFRRRERATARQRASAPVPATAGPGRC